MGAGAGKATASEVAEQYARDVLAGRILACQWVRLACARQLADLKRWGKRPRKDAPYWFSAARAQHIVDWFAHCPHVKGDLARQPIRLEPWEVFALSVLFGWERTDKPVRRYRTAYLEMGRKNAKSTLAAGIGTYLLAADDEEGAEVYSAATTGDQAAIVFGVAKRMVELSPVLRKRIGVLAHALVVERTGSIFRAVNSQSDTLDGKNLHCGIVDELHAHRTRGLWDVLETATGARSQSLLLAITTAGGDESGICYEIRTYLTKILQGLIEDETFFGLIYTLDEGDSWQDPAVWIKANPNLGVSVDVDDLKRKALKARETPAAQAAFQAKHCSVWVGAGNAFVNMEALRATGDPGLTLEQFRGQPCWWGLDLASKEDLAALMLIFRQGEDWYAFGRYYLPESVVLLGQHSRRAQYRGWADQGYLTLTDGNITDQNRIQEDCRALRSQCELREFGYDGFQAAKFASELLAEDFPMVEVGATVKNFSDPMKSIAALINAGRWHHDNNPVTLWAYSNVVAQLDYKDNVFPRKEGGKGSTSKIDPFVATCIAMNRALLAQEPVRSVYETEGLFVL